MITELRRLMADQEMKLEALKQRDLERTKEIQDFKTEWKDDLEALTQQLPKEKQEKFRKAVLTLRERKHKKT